MHSEENNVHFTIDKLFSVYMKNSIHLFVLELSGKQMHPVKINVKFRSRLHVKQMEDICKTNARRYVRFIAYEATLQALRLVRDITKNCLWNSACVSALSLSKQFCRLGYSTANIQLCICFVYVSVAQFTSLKTVTIGVTNR